MVCKIYLQKSIFKKINIRGEIIIEISKSKFIKLESLVHESDINMPSDQIDIKSVFVKMALRLKESEKKWKIILRLFEQDDPFLSVILEIDKGEFKLIKKIPDKYDLEISIQKDAWWDIVKGKMAPMEAFYKDKIHIKTAELGLANEFFKNFVKTVDKEKIIFI